MKKILYIIYHYPQLSETYIQVEMDTLLQKGYDIQVIALREANYASSHHLPYKIISDESEIIDYAKHYKPDIIHTHWIIYDLISVVYKVAKMLQVPYTVRSHSFDALNHFTFSGQRPKSLKKRFKQYIQRYMIRYMINDSLCKGILAFPFAKELFIRSGIEVEKIIEVPPVVDFKRFYNTSKNGTNILNLGAAFQKKNFEAFMNLGETMSSVSFHLYSIGYNTPQLLEKNKSNGMPITIHNAVEFSDMPSIYKESAWLVYTADISATVGWPLAALEAMASGTGVCLPNIRPDIKDYIGDAGIVYSDIDELKNIIDKPVSSTMREKGFKLAKKYDIQKQIHLLTDLW